MKRNFITFVAGIMFLSLFGINLASAGNWSKSPKKGVDKDKVYKDKDWSHSFYANAGFPSNSKERGNVIWREEGSTRFLRFRLFNEQIGTSESDNMERSRAPYWERAEVKAGIRNNVFYFSKTKTYDVEFRVRFVEGFVDDRETFLQIHNYIKSCKSSNTPPVMVKFIEGKLVVEYALAFYKHQKIWLMEETNIEDNYGKWIKFKLRISPSKAQKDYFNLVFFKNDVELGYQNMIWTAKCGKPHIKFGIYRPGSKDISLQTSIIDYDYIKIKEIKN